MSLVIRLEHTGSCVCCGCIDFGCQNGGLYVYVIWYYRTKEALGVGGVVVVLGS